MNATSKDVTVGGVEYKMGRVRANVGSSLLNLFIQKQTEAQRELEAKTPKAEPKQDAPKEEAKEPTPEERAAALAAMMAFFVGRLTFAEMDTVQDACLLPCARYETMGGKITEQPILAGPGRWNLLDLEYDAVTTRALVQESLTFNLAPFFTDAGSTAKP